MSLYGCKVTHLYKVLNAYPIWSLLGLCESTCMAKWTYKVINIIMPQLDKGVGDGHDVMAIVDWLRITANFHVLSNLNLDQSSASVDQPNTHMLL